MQSERHERVAFPKWTHMRVSDGNINRGHSCRRRWSITPTGTVLMRIIRGRALRERRPVRIIDSCSTCAVSLQRRLLYVRSICTMRVVDLSSSGVDCGYRNRVEQESTYSSILEYHGKVPMPLRLLCVGVQLPLPSCNPIRSRECLLISFS